jgi:hypothetical protein
VCMYIRVTSRFAHPYHILRPHAVKDFVNFVLNFLLHKRAHPRVIRMHVICVCMYLFIHVASSLVRPHVIIWIFFFKHRERGPTSPSPVTTSKTYFFIFLSLYMGFFVSIVFLFFPHVITSKKRICRPPSKFA